MRIFNSGSSDSQIELRVSMPLPFGGTIVRERKSESSSVSLFMEEIGITVDLK